MNNNKELIQTLSDYRTRWYIENSKNNDDLLKNLRGALLPEVFVQKVMELNTLRCDNPDSFKTLVADYQTYICNSKANELAKTFQYIQNILGGQDYFFKSNPITPKKLAKFFCTPFKGQNVFYKFSIDKYMVSVKMGFGKDEYKNPFSKIKIYKNGRCVKILTSSTLSNWSDIISVRFQKMQYCFSGMFEKIGTRYSMKLGMGSSDLSFFGHIVTDKSKKELKSLPTYFSDSNRKNRRMCVRTGDLVGLKKNLRKEYAKQKPIVLPEAMKIMYQWGSELINECKNYIKVLDPSVSIIDKIHGNVVGGSHHIQRIPKTEGVIPNRSNKVFLLSHRDDYQVNLIAQVLAHAGWEGSVLISSVNFPSIMDVLETGQTDYIIQSSLGRSHEKDLYQEEICKYLPDAEHYNGKVLTCEIYSRDHILSYAKDFTEEKIRDRNCRKV